jgi:hypothetical protein
MSTGKTYSVREAAGYLGVSTKSVRRYISRGLLSSKLVPGKHGVEILIFQKGLDTVLGQLRSMSKEKNELLEVSRLFQSASPEVRDVVLKILRSTGEEEKPRKLGGLISSLFAKIEG